MKKAIIALCSLIALGLSACAPHYARILEVQSDQPALKAMEHISNAAKHCWFNAHNGKFQHYLLAPELRSYSGRPRILVVPNYAPGERPLLVIEAVGSPAKVTAYGPLLDSRDGKAIANDIQHWAKGIGECQ